MGNVFEFKRKTTAVKHAYEIDEITARAIMGRDVIFPSEIAHMDSHYSPAQKKFFKENFPEVNALRFLKEKGFALFPGPSRASSLMHVRQINEAELFDSNSNWYTDKKHAFYRNEIVSRGWIALRIHPNTEAFGKIFIEQKNMLGANDRLPMTADVAWMMALFLNMQNGLPGSWEGKMFRTSSVDGNGHHVSIGMLHGKVTLSRDNGEADEKVGIASALLVIPKG